MKYNLCSSCIYFQPRLLTEKESIPKSCRCPYYSTLFSPEVGGFPSGIDIIHCDYHQQYPSSYGDVYITHDDIHGVSYVLTQPRNFKAIRVPKLYDNSKNIKVLKYDEKP